MTNKTHSRLKPTHIVFTAVFLLSAFGLRLWQLRWPEAQLQLGGEDLRVLIANTTAHKYRGLGKRDALAPYDGMIFQYAVSGHHGIVMRDMRFPIDIVWLQNGQVIDIAPNVPLELGNSETELTVYRPRLLANTVLELPAGWTGRQGLKIGDWARAIDGNDAMD